MSTEEVEETEEVEGVMCPVCGGLDGEHHERCTYLELNDGEE